MIYTDAEAAKRCGLRSRVYRENASGQVEWMFAVDYAGGSRKWLLFREGAYTLESLAKEVIDLEPWED